MDGGELMKAEIVIEMLLNTPPGEFLDKEDLKNKKCSKSYEIGFRQGVIAVKNAIRRELYE